MLVTDEEVKALITTERDTTPFIEAADLIVSEDLSGSGHSAARLKLIELYLAAHFTAITEERGGLISSKVGESSEVYATKAGSGFRLTRFGQHALALDTTGILASMASATNKAEFRVV